MTDLPVRLAAAIERVLAAHAKAERAAVLSGGYAPSALRHLGVSVPDLRGAVRRFSRETRAARPREVIALALALVGRRTVEGRQVGYELLARRAWREGRLSDATVSGWARSSDRWWRRTALASTVALNVAARGGHGDATRYRASSSQYCRSHAPARRSPTRSSSDGVQASTSADSPSTPSPVKAARPSARPGPSDGS